jgi:hypothetical protein
VGEGEDEVVEEEPPEPPRLKIQSASPSLLRASLGHISKGRLILSQVLLVIHEEPPGLPKAALHVSFLRLEAGVGSPEPHLSDLHLDQKLRLILSLDSIVITTLIEER